MRMLRQPQNSPYSHIDKVIILVCALSHGLDGIPLESVNDFLLKLTEDFRHDRSDVCTKIDASKDLDDEDRQIIIEYAKEANGRWLTQKQS